MAQIPFERVRDYQRLPIDAQDVVTRARVVVAAQATKDNLQSINTKFGPFASVASFPYYPVPIAVEHVAAEHATYRAVRSFELPAGIDPFLPQTSPAIPDPAGVAGFTNIGAVRDGDLSTYAEATEAGGSFYFPVFNSATTTVEHVLYGYRITYSLKLKAGGGGGVRTAVGVIQHEYNYDSISRRLTAAATYGLPVAGEPTTLDVYFPTPQRNELRGVPMTSGRQWLRLLFSADTGVSYLRVYEYYPLLLNVPLLESIARAQIRLPVSTPRRVTVRGYLPPGDLTHTITGWPGGDYTGVVARQSYREGNTIVDFEQAGAPPGVPQDALEAERVRTNRTRELVRAATYPTLVGNHVTR